MPVRLMPVAPGQGASAFLFVQLQRLGARGHKPLGKALPLFLLVNISKIYISVFFLKRISKCYNDVMEIEWGGFFGMYDLQEWRHVFKLDPNKEISDERLEKICESGTDAVIVGGTDGVTLENVLDLMARIRRYTVPCVLEVSSIETVTPGFDLYFIPTVLNSSDPNWITGLHHQAVKEYGDLMDWQEIVMEGYCIMNKDCKAAQLTSANTELSDEDVTAYAMMAEKMFQLPIFYLEYSGRYGDIELLAKVKKVLNNTVLFYGGGISTTDQASEMSRFADVIVVGNAIYDDFEQAIETVKSVR
jgi:putative glycerol-1-phosphate prenyltransferase